MIHVLPPINPLEKTMSKQYGSPRYTLALTDLKRIGLGAIVAAGGALLTYLSENIGGIDFGDWTPVAVAFLSVLVNVLRKFLTDTKYKY
jgi:hypothetical protein